LSPIGVYLTVLTIKILRSVVLDNPGRYQYVNNWFTATYEVGVVELFIGVTILPY